MVFLLSVYERVTGHLSFRALIAFWAILWGSCAAFLLFDSISSWSDWDRYHLTQHWSYVGALLLVLLNTIVALSMAWKKSTFGGYVFAVASSMVSGHFLFGTYLFPLDGYRYTGTFVELLLFLLMVVLPQVLGVIFAVMLGIKCQKNRGLCLFFSSLLPVTVIALTALSLKASLAQSYYGEAKLREIRKGLREKNWARVVSDCDLYLKRYEKCRAVYLSRGIALYWDGQYKRALDSLESSLNCPSKHPMAHYDIQVNRNVFYYTGVTHWSLRDYSAAYHSFDKAIKCDGDDGSMIPGKNWTVSHALFYRGSYYASKGKFQEALSDFQESSDLLKEDSDPFLEKVTSQIDKVKRAMKMPAESNRELQRGLRLYEQKEYAKAHEILKQAAERGNATAQNILGDMYVNGYHVAQDDQLALKYYEEAAKSGSSNAMISLGCMHEDGMADLAVDHARALELYKAAARLGNSYGLLNVGRMYAEGIGVGEDGKQALEYYSAAWRKGLRETDFYLGMLYQYGASGLIPDLEQAELWYRRGLKRNDIEAKNALAYLLALKGERLGEAEKMINEVLAEEPNDAGYIDTFGWILYQKREYEKAVKALKRADELCPNDGEILEHLGDAFHMLKKPGPAKQCWEKALKFAVEKGRKARLTHKLEEPPPPSPKPKP